MATQGLLG